MQSEQEPTSSPFSGTAGGLRDRHRILAVCCLSLFIVGLDITAVNVALPSIGRDLDAGISGLQWTVDAYTVVMASLLMLGGSTADRFGRKRLFIVGMTVFSTASLLCCVAPSIELLIAARVLQAVGASMLNPVAMSIITNTFTDPRERARAVGVWAGVFGISLAVGPTLGGLLVDLSGWRSIFLLNVPVGVAAVALTLRLIPESKAPRARRFDPAGQLLVIAVLASLTFGIIEAPHLGWASPAIVGALVAALAGFVALLRYEPRREEPLIDLRFFRSVPFACAVAIAVAGPAAFGGFLFLNTLYLQGARGFTPFDAGLAILPMAVMTAVAAPISGRIVARRGPRVPLVAAGCCLAVGSALLTGISEATTLGQLLLAYVIFGTGFGLVNAPITNVAVSSMPRAQAGVAAAIATTSRQVGLTLGVASVGAIVAADGGLATPAGVEASHPGWWLITACGVAVTVLGFLATTAGAEASAQRTAAALNPEALVL